MVILNSLIKIFIHLYHVVENVVVLVEVVVVLVVMVLAVVVEVVVVVVLVVVIDNSLEKNIILLIKLHYFIFIRKKFSQV